MTRASISRIVVAALALTLVLMAGGAALAVPKVWQARIRFLPAEQPALYVQVNSAGEMRMAESAEGLASAKPIWAEARQSYPQRPGELMQYFGFADMTLPVSVEGVEKVKASFSFTRRREHKGPKGPLVETANLSGRFVASRRGRDDKRWTYEFSPKPSAKDVMDVQVPDLRKLGLAVVTKIEGKKARIALQVKAGSSDITDVKKSGKSVACTMEVLDQDGKSVHSAKGDLQKFGFT
jgi:hypothetical protein